MSNRALGPSLHEVEEDLIASNELAEPGNYDFQRGGDGRLYAVGAFGVARVGVSLTMVDALPKPDDAVPGCA